MPTDKKAWTSDPPTSSGYYWSRPAKCQPVPSSDRDGAVCTCWHCDPGIEDIRVDSDGTVWVWDGGELEWDTLAEMGYDSTFEWYGPLEAPK